MMPSPIVQLPDMGGLTSFSHRAMATEFTLHLSAPDDVDLRAVAAEVFRRIDRIEEKLSFYREASDVSRINRAAPGDTLVIDECTADCLMLALEVAVASEGRFDPFVGAQALLAKAQPTPPHLADLPANEDRIHDPSGATVAIDPLALSVTKIQRHGWLDLGAVGKGAALDAIGPVLADWNVTSAVLVAGGSSVLVLGPPPKCAAGGGWRLIFSELPGRPELAVAAPFALGASGLGFQPGHIVSAEGRLPQSRTIVLAPSAALADALSTAAMAMTDIEIARMMKDERDIAVFAEANDPTQTPCATGVCSRLIPPSPEMSLVIPCWCESRRLPPFLTALCEALAAVPLSVEVVVVDDGSPAAEKVALEQTVNALRASHRFLRPLVSLAHKGKGGAIHAGWQCASASARWLGLVDADGAVSPAEVRRGIEVALATKNGRTVIAGSRYHHDAQRPVRRNFWRGLSGRWFAAWARRRLALQAEDCQCGFKLVPAGWWRSRRAWHEAGYAFDLELLCAAREDGLRLSNLAIAWREVGESRVRLNDGLQLLRAVRRLRKSSPPARRTGSGRND